MFTWIRNQQIVNAWAGIEWKAKEYWGIEARAQIKGLAIMDQGWGNSKIKAK